MAIDPSAQLTRPRISLPLGALAAGMMMISFTTPSAAAPASATLKEKVIHMDLVGSLSIMASSICFVLAMHWAGSLLPWNSPPVIASLAAFGALLGFFFLNEWRMGSNAMIQAHLLKKPAIRANLIYMFFISGLYFSLLYSLPIQFQAINSNSASQSGLRLIPLVLGISVFTMVANTILTFWRHYVPFLVLGGLFGTVGASMIYTLDSSASVGTWVAYELLTAIGIGLSLQVPMIANQAAVTAEDIPAVTSITLFVETIGQALFVAAGEAALTNQLVKSLTEYAPKLDPLSVIHAGASQIRDAFAPADVPGILMSYLEGCQVGHLVSLSCGVAASLVSIAVAVPAGKTQLMNWMHKPHLP
jgi:MFS family permease